MALDKDANNDLVHLQKIEFDNVTPNDAVDIKWAGANISVGTSGNVQLTGTGMKEGTSVVIFLAAGVIHPIRVKRVWAANLTAADIVMYK